MRRLELTFVGVIAILAGSLEIGWCNENALVNRLSPSSPQLTSFWRQQFMHRLLKKRRLEEQQPVVSVQQSDEAPTRRNLRVKRFDPKDPWDRLQYARPGPQTRYVYAQAQRYAPYEYPKWYDWHILRTNAILRTGVPKYSNVW